MKIDCTLCHRNANQMLQESDAAYALNDAAELQCARFSSPGKAFYWCIIMLQNIEESLLDEMMEAGRQERQLAIDAGDVLPDGTPWITVVVDGSWGTRSHGHRYSSNGGMAAIIGLRTKKLLYYGVRNKFCIVCVRAVTAGSEPKEHRCFRNWVGSSTAMEADVICEGFAKSEDMHGVQYMEFIGDGDSSVHSKIMSSVWYGRDVRKIECANHVVKNYTKALYELAKRDQFARKILSTSRIERMKICVRKMIRYRAEERVESGGDRDVSAGLLTNDVRNAAFHVLGHHGKCEKYFCNIVGNSAAAVRAPPLEIPSTLRAALLRCAELVCNKARSLVVLNVTSNLAESLMSRVAKLLSGKAKNHYQRGGYHSRVAAAGLAFQSGSSMHLSQCRVNVKRTPSNTLKKFVESKKRMRDRTPADRNRRYVRRRLQAPADSDYGPNSARPDRSETDPDLYKHQQQAVVDELTLSQSQRLRVREATSQDREAWFRERKNRITGSSFHQVANMRNTTSCAKVLDRLMYDAGRDVDTPALRYGREHEDLAIRAYEAKFNCSVQRPVGLIVHPVHGFLAATPDGVVSNDLILEVKCPKNAENTNINDLIEKGTFLDKNKCLKKTHDYYSQVQCQLACTGARFCDFFVWSPTESVCDRIEFDQDFFENKLKRIFEFFHECILPEIVDPRKCRSMPYRERKSFVSKRPKLSQLTASSMPASIV